MGRCFPFRVNAPERAMQIFQLKSLASKKTSHKILLRKSAKAIESGLPVQSSASVSVSSFKSFLKTYFYVFIIYAYFQKEMLIFIHSSRVYLHKSASWLQVVQMIRRMWSKVKVKVTSDLTKTCSVFACFSFYIFVWGLRVEISILAKSDVFILLYVMLINMHCSV